MPPRPPSKGGRKAIHGTQSPTICDQPLTLNITESSVHVNLVSNKNRGNLDLITLQN